MEVVWQGDRTRAGRGLFSLIYNQEIGCPAGKVAGRSGQYRAGVARGRGGGGGSWRAGKGRGGEHGVTRGQSRRGLQPL